MRDDDSLRSAVSSLFFSRHSASISSSYNMPAASDINPSGAAKDTQPGTKVPEGPSREQSVVTLRIALHR